MARRGREEDDRRALMDPAEPVRREGTVVPDVDVLRADDDEDQPRLPQGAAAPAVARLVSPRNLPASSTLMVSAPLLMSSSLV